MTIDTISNDSNETIYGLPKMPYVLPDAVLMAPGVWNGHYYSKEEIIKAFNNTDWNDRDNRALYLDHEDEGISKWVGEVGIPIVTPDGELIGDLVFSDLNEATKIHYGKPKSGISPKVDGMTNGVAMMDFTYKNFSWVRNPAVKKAFLYNFDGAKPVIQEEMSDFGKKRKKLGMSLSEFYAIPGKNDEESRLPIFDTSHTKKAITLFEELGDEEKKDTYRKIVSAAKQFGLDSSGFEEKHGGMSMAKQNKANEAPKTATLAEFTEFVKEYQEKNKGSNFNDSLTAFQAMMDDSTTTETTEEVTPTPEPVPAEPVESPAEETTPVEEKPEEESASESLSSSEIATLKELLAKATSKVPAVATMQDSSQKYERVIATMSQKMTEMEKKMIELRTEQEKPVRAGQFQTVELSQQDLPQTVNPKDAGMLNYLKEVSGGAC